ncbi:MAG: translesion DNA synthesis-associated protein ImuA [Thiotrichales bacterium]
MEQSHKQDALESLLREQAIWRGRDHGFHGHRSRAGAGLATGYSVLDEALPESGWPTGALTELLSAQPGQGVLRLVLPALRKLTGRREYVAMIDPPWLPYAPALSAAGIGLPYLLNIGPLPRAEQTWALEQVLRSGHFPVVLAWPGREVSIKVLRRLQLAAESSQSVCFLFRDSACRQQHSPAALRLQLKPQPPHLSVEVLKCRGRYFSQALLV